MRCFVVFLLQMDFIQIELLAQGWKAFVLYSVLRCVSKLAPLCASELEKITCVYKSLFSAKKRSVVFMCTGWISPPPRNPMCVCWNSINVVF